MVEVDLPEQSSQVLNFFLGQLSRYVSRCQFFYLHLQYFTFEYFVNPTILEKSTFKGVRAASFITHGSLNTSSQVILFPSGRRIFEIRVLASLLILFIYGTEFTIIYC